jgi:membrane protein
MGLKDYFSLLKDSGRDFVEDDCSTQAAALSYYTVFSLPPLLLLLLMLVGALVDRRKVEGAIQTQINSLMGSGAAEQIRTILQFAHRPGSGGIIATVVGLVTLLLGAAGAFGQLQAALNRAWEVVPDPQQGGLKAFLIKRVFSFGMVLSVAFLLLVSLVLSAALSGLGDRLGDMLPEGLSSTLLQVLNQVLSFVVITALFAAIFKVLPDATAAWRDVWVGAAVTALLFVLGKYLIGLYLGRSNPGEAFGAAGSLALILVWIYYSSMILLFGAEFTQAWAEKRGSGVAPEKGAVRVNELTKERTH